MAPVGSVTSTAFRSCRYAGTEDLNIDVQGQHVLLYSTGPPPPSPVSCLPGGYKSNCLTDKSHEATKPGPKSAKLEMTPQLLLVIGMAMMVSGNVYDEFKQWDPTHWVVRSTARVELPCYHQRYYPFNNLDSMEKVVWILPKQMSYLHMSPGNESEGWKVLDRANNYTIVIEKEKMNVPDTVNGMYLCAALAQVAPPVGNNKTYAWFYLRWGVGLYANVPANKEGTVPQRYYWPFTYAWIAALVAITAFGLFAATVHFRYKGGPIDSSKKEGSDIDSFTLTEVEQPSSLEKAKHCPVHFINSPSPLCHISDSLQSIPLPFPRSRQCTF
ncbi:expressed conserved protein [Echinococcus multilocularis]|uniref:Expressed conserved protein n=1 Tax=Echinococcus multilocularis TaxID=6211 RepID=A0A068YHY1_ECHMU|nr:expressed conserved protein [Echinococcus multilocularis]